MLLNGHCVESSTLSIPQAKLIAARTAAARKKMIQKKFRADLIFGLGFKNSVKKTITTAKVAMKTQAILTFRRCLGRPAS